MKASQIGGRNPKKTQRQNPYNLRSKEQTETPEMSDAGENSGDDHERTVIANQTTVDDLLEQISQLQMSLASSEKEKQELHDVISRQQAVSTFPIVTSQNSEAVSASAPAISTVAGLTLNAISAVAGLTSNAIGNTPHNFAFNAYTAASISSAASVNVNGGASANGIYTAYNSVYTNPTSVYAPSSYRASSSLFASSAYGDFITQHRNNVPFQNTSSWNVPSTVVRSTYPVTGYATSQGTPAVPVSHFTYANSHGTPAVPISHFGNSQLGITGQPPIRKVHDLPEFHGSPEAWPMFSVAFRETTRLYAYTDLDNLLRLQKALKGKSRQQVESLLIHPSNVNAVMITLEHHYGRPELLVRSQIAKARAHPAVSSGKISDILSFSTMVTNLTAFLESSGATPHLNNPILIDELLGKLPFNKREEWTRHLLSLGQQYPTVRDFCNWLQHVALYVSMATDVMPTKQSSAIEQPSFRSKQPAKTVLSISKDDQKCLLCSETHSLFQCKKFKASDYSARWNIVKKHNLCFACLQSGHNLQQCSKRRVCGLQSCDRFHNRMLHKTDVSKNNDKSVNAENVSVATVSCFPNSKSSLHTSNLPCQQQPQTLLKYLPVTLKGPKGEVNIIAFIDEGAKISLLEESVANAIGVKGKADLLRLKWIGNQTTSEQSRRVSVEIAGNFVGSTTYEMRDVRTTKKLYLPQQSLNLCEFTCQQEQLIKENIFDYVNATPQLLIGLPHTNLIRPISVSNIDEGFAAHLTKLGWTIFGSNEQNAANGIIGHVDYEVPEWHELNNKITEYFAAEQFEVKTLPLVRSDADIRAEELLKSTTKFANGRYETGLLWRDDQMQFPDSYEVAVKRLQQIENKMLNNVDYCNWYCNKINEYVEKGYAKKLSMVEAKQVDDRTWYLPHFAASNPNKGNKRRLVFDAAAKANGVSLNSALMKGPSSYQPKLLLSILFQFRQGRVAVCGDIREMFHRVLIRKEDQNSQRFLWRGGNIDKPPDVYVMGVMFFGSISSPCSAQYVKNLNAEKYRSTYPRAANAIVERHYVDDYMDSFNAVEDAINVTKEVIEIHGLGGFELRNIISNSEEVMESVASSAAPCTQNEITTNKGESNTEKVLGMHWSPNEDYFCFRLSFVRVPKAVLDGTRKPTTGEMLSLLMSIFDPFGLLCNATICAKVLLQRLWKRNVDWHEPIPDDIYAKWFEWYTGLKGIEGLTLRRCYHLNFLDDRADIQLHIFTDASELAFSAVAYWRVSFEGDTEVIFVAGRSRCSPLKPLSIPRLELQAAVLGVRLKETIISSHDVNPKTVKFWTDSKTVIQWIRSDARNYKQFVAHRIAEVLQSSEVPQWRWVSGSENPADDATRPKVFNPNCKWVNGPQFLKKDEDYWPTMPKDLCENHNDTELRSKPLYTVNLPNICIPFEKYTNLHKFLRVMSWLRYALVKFKALSQNTDFAVPKTLSAPCIKQTEAFICRLVQEAEFPEEMQSLRSQQSVKKSSSLYKLCPTMDEEGVMRLSGRIDYANCVSSSTKRPIILPKAHPFSRLIARHYHEVFHHHNFEAAVAAIRYTYCIPSIRRLLRSVKASCQLCKNLTAVPETPQMGQLPKDRLTPFVRPFSYTGVDYFGPVMVSIGRRREKRWVAIFTCLTVRAIHLELAKDLSADATIIVCRNFINRRGVPIRMRSDRGTNFVGASKEMWVQVERGIGEECCRRGVEWLFNVPANPAAGGVWERMVQTVKRVLQFTLKEKAPQVETLQSLLIEAENLVNSRPLTQVPLDSIDDEPLTPNHFLLGCPNFVQTPEPQGKLCLRKQWHISQQLMQTFWKRWVLEYLPTLTRRTKWFKRVKPICVGDVVIICDDNESRGQWKRGIVLEATKAADGQVRSALVKTTAGNLRRPASKIAVLDVKGDSLDSEPNHGEEDVADKT